jgi:quercetin dioxygenase-like cupin family protein
MSSHIVKREQCSHHSLFPGVDMFTTAGMGMTLSFVEFEPGAVVESHSHPHEQMRMLLQGELTFIIGGERHVLSPGDMWRIPGNVEHSAIAGDSKVRALDVFQPIREDYR